MIDLPYNWKPRDYQLNAWNAFRNLTNPAHPMKRAIIGCHRRWGKDDIMLHHNACAAFEKVGNYWYLLPEYSQCRKAIWTAINPHSGKRRIDEAFPKELRAKTLDHEMFIEFKNGSTWQLMGSDNYDSLVGAPPAGLTFSEYAISNPNSWEYLSPIMMENGGWAIFNSTTRGKNHFYHSIEYAKTDPDWYWEISTANDTTVFTPEQLDKELKRLQKINGDDYGKAIWLQEYFCSFSAAIPGAIWADSIIKLENEGRFCKVPHIEGYPVHSAWDVGFNDDTAIWFYQVIGEKINVLKYYSNNFKDIPFFGELLYKLAKANGWRYGNHFLPHDAFNQTFAAGGKTIIQQFFDQIDIYQDKHNFNIGSFRRTPDVSKENGIQAAHVTFHMSYFDEDTIIGFEHLKSYHRHYDQELKMYESAIHRQPHAHAADSWRYLSLTWRLAKAEQRVMTSNEALMAGNIFNVTFGDIKKEHFKKKQRERASKL